jgi:hypothetical protein
MSDSEQEKKQSLKAMIEILERRAEKDGYASVFKAYLKRVSKENENAEAEKKERKDKDS